MKVLNEAETLCYLQEVFMSHGTKPWRVLLVDPLFEKRDMYSYLKEHEKIEVCHTVDVIFPFLGRPGFYQGNNKEEKESLVMTNLPMINGYQVDNDYALRELKFVIHRSKKLVVTSDVPLESLSNGVKTVL